MLLFNNFLRHLTQVGAFDPTKKKKKKKKESAEGDAGAEVADVQEKIGSLSGNIMYSSRLI